MFCIKFKSCHEMYQKSYSELNQGVLCSHIAGSTMLRTVLRRVPYSETSENLEKELAELFWYMSIQKSVRVDEYHYYQVFHYLVGSR